MYLLIYICVSVISIFLWIRIYAILRNISGLYFLAFTTITSIWFILYFLYFTNFLNSTLSALYISRIAFWIWIIWVYCLLFFITFFNYTFLYSRYLSYIFIIISSLLLWVYVFTDLIIAWLNFSVVDLLYREVYGKMYYLTLIFYAVFLIAFIIVAFLKNKQLSNLERIRFRKIINSAYFMLFIWSILQLILPYFNIWILEKEIIFLYLIFVISVYFTLTRYYFDASSLWIWKALVYISAFVVAILTHISINIYFPDGMNLGAFWDVPYSWEILNVTMSIWLFVFTQKVLTKYVIWNENKESIREHIFSLQNQIVSILDINKLNTILFEWLNKIFLLKHAHIYVFGKDKKTKKFLYLKRYFEKSSYKIYIHDIVFWEEKSDYKYMESVKNEIAEWTFLVLPLLFDGECLGIFTLWSKNFNDAYTREEIRILENFSRFLSAHVRYLAIYGALQDLSLNLDKKVDDKTIEYNDLINRQKEFIALISHEIKSPLSSAIFQSDSILHDLDTILPNSDKMREELTILNTQLVRTGWLISKLFSVQYYDNHNVNLFLEEIGFTQFLEYEIELFSRMYEDITFISQIDKEIGFIKIDKIQFQQVINNLLDNAVKFTENTDPIIAIKAQNIAWWIEIIIEDNGKWFADLSIENIFDKYTTGSNKNVWLWMGLYLCEKIVSMHAGTIKASYSEIYGGARFTIFLPKL